MASRLLCLLTVLLVVVQPAAPAWAARRAPRTSRTRTTTVTTVPGPPPMPKAWILVDVDTRRVLDEHDDHALRRPASIVKLLSVLTAERLLRPNAQIPVSALAASMPARKIGLVAGDSWPLPDILDSVVVVSANDAAVALAEAASGSVEEFGKAMTRTARELGVVDSPTFADPAGLDDEFQAGGGDWVSAWDMAIIGVAALHDPAITTRASSPVLWFTDPSGELHRLVNHNRLLQTYPGATGLKPGYTRRAGNTLVASATRDGRTMLVVVLDAPDLYGPVRSLLDKGFSTPARGETGPRLVVHALPAPASSAAARSTEARVTRRASSTSFARDQGEWLLLAAGATGVSAVGIRRRRRRPF